MLLIRQACFSYVEIELVRELSVRGVYNEHVSDVRLMNGLRYDASSNDSLTY